MGKKVILVMAVVALFLVTPLLAFAMSDSEESNLKAIQTAIDDTGANWTVGETSVSGFSWEEKKKLCGLNGFPEMEEGAKTELRSYPSTFDWRDVSGTDWTTTIKDLAEAAGHLARSQPWKHKIISKRVIQA